MKRKSSEPPHPVDILVGQRLRAARLLAGFSQSKLGNHVGLTFQQIQKYEKGMNRIGASRLQQFAQLLNVPATYFFDQQVDEYPAAGAAASPGVALPSASSADPSQPSEADLRRRRQTRDLLDFYDRIEDETMRASILQLVRTAAGQRLP